MAVCKEWEMANLSCTCKNKSIKCSVHYEICNTVYPESISRKTVKLYISSYLSDHFISFMNIKPDEVWDDMVLVKVRWMSGEQAGCDICKRL